MDANNSEEPQQTTGRWSKQEQERFEEALQLHGRSWKEVSQHVGTRTMVQVRSHAQKYFKKLRKTMSKTKQPLPMPGMPACQATFEDVYQEWMFHCSKASEYFYALSQFPWPLPSVDDVHGLT